MLDNALMLHWFRCFFICALLLFGPMRSFESRLEVIKNLITFQANWFAFWKWMYGIGLSVVASFRVRMDGRAGGLMSTAMRATDILMDRVYQLEMDLFERSSGSLFIPITQVVSQKQDAYAPHPEIQRQASLIRTDMDHFTDLEVSTLVQHGYCGARQRCCRVTGLVPAPQSTGEIWNPVQVPAKGAGGESGAVVSLDDETTALATAKWLKK